MRARPFLIIAAVLAADQLTKQLIVSRLDEGSSIPVTGFFEIAHIRNPGAAFGLFRGAPGVLTVAAVAGVAMLAFFLRRRPPVVSEVAASLVAGGALGNLFDRFFRPWPLRGTVVDFLSFSFWPAFNVADIAITSGALLLLLASRNDPAPEHEQVPQPQTGPDAGSGG